MKLDIKDFETLQDGLDMLFHDAETLPPREQKKVMKRVKEAEDALIAIGTY